MSDEPEHTSGDDHVILGSKAADAASRVALLAGIAGGAAVVARHWPQIAPQLRLDWLGLVGTVVAVIGYLSLAHLVLDRARLVLERRRLPVRTEE